MNVSTQMKKNEPKDLETTFKEEEIREGIFKDVARLIKEWKELALIDQRTRRNSILAALPILSPEDRKLCISHLANAGIAEKKSAIKQVNGYAKDLGIDKIEEVPSFPLDYCKDFSSFTPALDFKNNIVYVTVPINQFVGNKPVPVNFVITSEREKFRLDNPEELLKRKLYAGREPSPNMRWSQGGREEYFEETAGVDIFELFEEIEESYTHYVDFDDKNFSSYMAAWVIATYFHPLFQSFPYVHFHGDAGSGKTKTLTLSSCLAFNGILTCNSTPAYIVRSVHDNQSSCFVDEAEKLKANKDQDNQTAIGVFNGGYKQGITCGKCEQVGGKNGKWIPKEYSAFSPKMFASIRGLDPALKTRCVPVTMLKSGNQMIENREISINDPKFQKIRDKLYRMLMDYHIQVRVKYALITDNEIFGREWELWKSILTVAKVIDEYSDNKCNIYKQLRELALKIQSLRREASKEEATPKLIATLYDFVTHNQNSYGFYQVETLLGALKSSGEEDFDWLKDDKIKAKKGRWLGNQLRMAGVVEGPAKQKKINGINVKGFYIEPTIIKKRLQNFGIKTADIDNDE